jgi:flagellar hook-length control protein FliK
MISAAKTTAPVSNNSTGTPAATGHDSGSTNFDTILALESIAATPTGVSQAALDLTSSLGAGATLGDDANADDGDNGVETDPLAVLAALLAYPIAAAPTAAASAATDAADDATDGIQDALAAAGKQVGHAIADATAASSSAGTADSGDANAAPAIDPKTTDASLTSQWLAGTGAEAPRPDDAGAQAPRGVDAAASARAAEMLAHAPRHATANDQATIATPARDPRWAEDFSTRIALMVRGGESSASLQLTPVDLGPMEVSITVRDSQASIHFGAAQAETRALIESSIPQLREMLAAQGFQLMDASVSQGFARQTRPEIPGVSRGQVEPESEVAAVRTRVTLDGLLDTYA